MKTIKFAPSIEKDLVALLKSYPLIGTIVQSITDHKGQAFLVGGAVRDLLLDREIKDLDIEVHGIALADLEKLLASFGPISSVGKSFGVLKLHRLDVDWSLPRIDKAGRKPEVIIDPDLSLEQAFKRRDLTINAMGIDLVSHNLVDPFGGLEDLNNRVLRAPDATLFAEDPLRLFRVMQFVGRFEMQPTQELNDICRNMDISGVSCERIDSEFEKLLLQSQFPSLGFKWLQTIDRLSQVLPELHALIGIPQEADYHPEGDVFEHTMQALDASAVLEYADEQEKLIVMLAVVCHDLGKSVTTENIGGRWKSLGHEHEGVLIAKNLLKRMTRKQDVINAVLPLVRYHMSPVQLPSAHATPAAYKRLAHQLAPDATMAMLAKVALADHQGRNPIQGKPLKTKVSSIDTFFEYTRAAHVESEPEAHVVHGRDLVGVIEPGPEMGEFLKKTYELQLQEGILDKDELIARVLAEIKMATQEDDKKT